MVRQAHHERISLSLIRSSKINKVKINGGELRSRVITFPDAEGLRPTPDRVRQTLFNWLGQTLHGRSCLDLFAGSGALGFEAASRGAARVTMIESNAAVCRALRANIEKLALRNVSAYCQDGLEFAPRDKQQYDIIFIDPPFQSNFLARLFEILPARLTADGVLYVESGAPISASDNWQVVKAGKAGQVHYQLLKINQAA